MIELDTIICGDCFQVMKDIEDKSVNCIITSPPYWGLRDYKTDGIIWDCDPECGHNWQQNISQHDNLRPSKVSENTQVGSNKELSFRTGKDTNNMFCSKCGAWKGSLGLESDFASYIRHLIQIFDECKRILRDDGTLWVNIGDTYSGSGNGSWNAPIEQRGKHGSKHYGKQARLLSEGEEYLAPPRKQNGVPAKSLCDIPFRFSIAMIDNGWIKRNTIIWHKPNCMPASAKDRFTIDFEYVFFFTKSKKYYFEQQFEPQGKNTHSKGIMPIDTEAFKNKSIRADGSQSHKDWNKYTLQTYLPQGRNKRCVWSIPTKPFSEAHFATFPETLIEPMIKAGCPEGGLVMDPFMGAGTVAVVAKKLGRHWLGSELNPEYVDMANKRIDAEKAQLRLF